MPSIAGESPLNYSIRRATLNEWTSFSRCPSLSPRIGMFGSEKQGDTKRIRIKANFCDKSLTVDTLSSIRIIRKPPRDLSRCSQRPFHACIRQLVANVFVMKSAKYKKILCSNVTAIL